MFGDARALAGLPLALGLLLVALAVLAYVRLQTLAFALRDREQQSRFASNLRDGVNLGALALLFGALLACGLPPAAGLLYAGTIGVLLEVLRRAGGRSRRLTAATAVAGLLLALPVALWSGRAVVLANQLGDRLFPRG